jgi:hypothetical protein
MCPVRSVTYVSGPRASWLYFSADALIVIAFSGAAFLVSQPSPRWPACPPRTSLLDVPPVKDERSHPPPAAVASMRCQPVARRPLRRRHIGFGHLVGNFATQADRIRFAFHGRKIEPFVSRHEIDRHRPSDRVHHAELVKNVGVGGCLAERRSLDFRNFKTPHFNLPFPLTRVSLSGDRALLVDQRPMARIMRRKFERWFKGRDEWNMNCSISMQLRNPRLSKETRRISALRAASHRSLTEASGGLITM